MVGATKELGSHVTRAVVLRDPALAVGIGQLGAYNP